VVAGQSFRRMPGGGPFMSDEAIATLADWIDRNCPNPYRRGRARVASRASDQRA